MHVFDNATFYVNCKLDLEGLIAALEPRIVHTCAIWARVGRIAHT
jgi:hypothetical protein